MQESSHLHLAGVRTKETRNFNQICESNITKYGRTCIPNLHHSCQYIGTLT